VTSLFSYLLKRADAGRYINAPRSEHALYHVDEFDWTIFSS
jgi:hypothetical protein